MKKISALVVVLALVLSCFSFSASAATIDQNTSSATVGVFYNLHGQYSISIPSSLILSQNDVLEISADYMHLTSTESVVVKLSENSFDSDGSFKLESHQDSSYKMSVFLLSSTSENSEGTEIRKDNAASNPIVTYTSENVDCVGFLQLLPEPDRNSPGGAYSGTLMFDITLQVAEG